VIAASLFLHCGFSGETTEPRVLVSNVTVKADEMGGSAVAKGISFSAIFHLTNAGLRSDRASHELPQAAAHVPAV
jgi:hypothetical protein